MKSLMHRLVSSLSLFALTVVPAVCAVYPQKVNVKVPFDFVVGGKTMPAGTYSVTGSGSGPLRISGQEKMTVLANAAYSTKTPETTKVTFHRYGDQYFVESIWVAGNGTGTQVLPSRRERMLARGNVRPEVLTLIGSLR